MTNTKLAKLVFSGYVQSCGGHVRYMCAKQKGTKMTCFYEKYTRIVSLQFVKYGLCFAYGLKSQWNLTTE